MSYLWPEGTAFHRQSPPNDPVLLQIDQALEPIRPLLRGLEFTHLSGGERQVQIGLGSDFDLLSVCWRPDALFIDLPVGCVFRRPADLLAVLLHNWRQEWQFRADGVTPPREGDQGPEVVLVLEMATTPDRLTDLARLLLEGWRQKILIQAMIYTLRGDNV